MAARDREVFVLLRAIYGMKNAEIAKKAGVSSATIAKWRKPLNEGGTRHQRFHTMRLVAKAVGMRFELVSIHDRPAAINGHAEHVAH
jgi:DNA-binding phage protein